MSKRPDNEQLANLLELLAAEEKVASEIMDGINDGYDGADGARTVLAICDAFESVFGPLPGVDDEYEVVWEE